MTNNPQYIVIHCTDVSYKTQPDQFISTNNYHQSQGFPVSSLGLYVGYHVLISNGTRYVCKEDTDEGGHCNTLVNGKSMNYQSLGVCVGFDGDIEPMKENDYILLQKQVWDWQQKWNIPNERVKLHRFFNKNKSCPGGLITDAWLASLLKRPQQTPTQSCIAEKTIIAEQNKKIEWYVALIAQLKKLIG